MESIEVIPAMRKPGAPSILWFATDQRRRVQRIFGISKMFAQSTPPYATETLCADQTFPPGTRLFNLLSHTHKRGKRFWVESAAGSLIYENFVYNDPVKMLILLGAYYVEP